jgi:poly(A) polymerase
MVERASFTIIFTVDLFGFVEFSGRRLSGAANRHVFTAIGYRDSSAITKFSSMKPTRELAPNPPFMTGASPAEAHERASSECLLAFIDAAAPTESEDQRGVREEVLNQLTVMLKDWIAERAVAAGLYADAESARAEVGGRICVSGSYRLAINDIGGDVDTVAVCPSFISADDFYGPVDESARAESGCFAERLRAHPDLTDLNTVRARASIIEAVIAGVSIDMGFARIAAPTVSDSINLLDDAVLEGISDKQTQIALNGPRVTELIPHLLPPGSWEAFTVLVRAMRLWARRRGLYSNKLGFLGGVNFNILAVYVCQRYPSLAPAALFYRFFYVMRLHQWPTPIMIDQPYLSPTLSFNSDVWQAGSLRGGNMMPIITPSYPCQNSSFNVSRSTLLVMRAEFERGYLLARDTLSGADPSIHDWAPVFEPTDFFTRFENYLQLDLWASDDRELGVWRGWVESKVRLLVEDLEKVLIGVIYPWQKAYEREETVEIKVHPPEGPSAADEATLAALASATGAVAAAPKSSESHHESQHGLKREREWTDDQASLDAGAAREAAEEDTKLVQARYSMSEKTLSAADASAAAATDPPAFVKDAAAERDSVKVENKFDEKEPAEGDASPEVVEASARSSHSPVAAPLPGIQLAVAVAAVSEGDKSASPTAAPCEKITALRTVCSLFIGLEPDTRAMAGVPLKLTDVLVNFKRLVTASPQFQWRRGMSLKQRVVKWAALPDAVLLPATRAEAAAARNKARADRRTAFEAATRAAEATQKSRVYVRPGSGAAASSASSGSTAPGAGATASAPASAAAAALTPAALALQSTIVDHQTTGVPLAVAAAAAAAGSAVGAPATAEATAASVMTTQHSSNAGERLIHSSAGSRSLISSHVGALPSAPTLAAGMIPGLSGVGGGSKAGVPVAPVLASRSAPPSTATAVKPSSESGGPGAPRLTSLTQVLPTPPAPVPSTRSTIELPPPLLPPPSAAPATKKFKVTLL